MNGNETELFHGFVNSKRMESKETASRVSGCLCGYSLCMTHARCVPVKFTLTSFFFHTTKTTAAKTGHVHTPTRCIKVKFTYSSNLCDDLGVI
jgi:hypothetical protein